MNYIYKYFIKRLLDIILSGSILALLSPALILVAIIIKYEDRGLIFYKQPRLGLDGKIFQVLKFRSMTYRPERVPGEAGELVADNSEFTNIGRLIRRFKVDELPQMICVFVGDMSLIGPRPCLPELASDFNEDGRKRLQVRPGCSGLAQVNGNIHLNWSERWKYDAYYVDHISLQLDTSILLKTLKLIFYGEKHFVTTFDDFINKNKNGAKNER